MNIYSRLSDKSNFSSAEAILVNYILNHSDTIRNYSIRKLAKQSGVSISTIYRVLEKLEVSGFSELKLQLANHKESYLSERTSVDYNFPFTHHSTHYQILRSIQSVYSSTIESTLNLIDLKMFLKASQLINNSDNIYVFSSSSNSPITFIFKEQMATIKKKVEIITDPHNIKYYYNTISNKDVAIVITYLNRSNFAPLMQLLNDRGIKTILISSSNEKSLTSPADVYLRLCPYEHETQKISNYSSRISILFLFQDFKFISEHFIT